MCVISSVVPRHHRRYCSSRNGTAESALQWPWTSPRPKAGFTLEDVYDIDYGRTPWPFDRRVIAQFSKWWATRPGVAVHLMLAAHEYALKHGRTTGIVEVKPRIVERVGEFGMALVEVPGATLQIHGLSERGEGYYAEPPPPKLYMFDIRANAEALRQHIEH